MVLKHTASNCDYFINVAFRKLPRPKQRFNMFWNYTISVRVFDIFDFNNDITFLPSKCDTDDVYKMIVKLKWIKKEIKHIVCSTCLLRYGVVRVFVSFCVLEFVRAILSWCP